MQCFTSEKDFYQNEVSFDVNNILEQIDEYLLKEQHVLFRLYHTEMSENQINVKMHFVKGDMYE